MDLAETALNLQDIKPSLKIFVLINGRSAGVELCEANAVLHAIPDAKIVDAGDLQRAVIAFKS